MRQFSSDAQTTVSQTSDLYWAPSSSHWLWQLTSVTSYEVTPGATRIGKLRFQDWGTSINTLVCPWEWQHCSSSCRDIFPQFFSHLDECLLDACNQDTHGKARGEEPLWSCSCKRQAGWRKKDDFLDMEVPVAWGQGLSLCALGTCRRNKLRTGGQGEPWSIQQPQSLPH